MTIAAQRTSHTDWRAIAWFGGALAGIVLALRLVGSADLPGVENFILVFGSLLIEAFPFILLGAIVSAAIEVFVPETFFARIALLPPSLQLPAAGVAGFAFPVCECGSVPVARRMASKGLAPGAAAAFMLAAPILNPIVLISTWVAYRGREMLWPMMLGRAGLGLVAAIAVGWVIARQTRDEFLRALPDEHDEHESSRESRASAFFGHVAGDFVFMGRFLVFGAAVAAGLQTLVPQSIMGSVAETPMVNLLAMMSLAFFLSLCSESDAFVAASFVQFGVGPQLAFLVFGPMADTKLGFLYSGAFTRGFFRTVILVAGAVTLTGTLWFEVIFG